nr:hypothetical protein PanWU01x14_322940 [Ipomoea trifida]
MCVDCREREGGTLETIAVLGLFTDDIENGVDELSALSVVSLSPVVAGAGLTEDEVVGAEDLAVGAGADGVHGARLEIHEDGAGDEAAAASLVVVDVDALELEVGVAMVAAGGVDPVLGADHLPELGSDLVAALAALDVKNLAHFGLICEERDLVLVNELSCTMKQGILGHVTSDNSR